MSELGPIVEHRQDALIAMQPEIETSGGADQPLRAGIGGKQGQAKQWITIELTAGGQI